MSGMYLTRCTLQNDSSSTKFQVPYLEMLSYSRYTRNCQVLKCHIHDLWQVVTIYGLNNTGSLVALSELAHYSSEPFSCLNNTCKMLPF